MHHPLGSIRISRRLALPVLTGVVFGLPPALANPPLRGTLPPPRPAEFNLAPFPTQIEWGVPDEGESLEPLLFEPNLDRAAIAAISKSISEKRTNEIPVGTIRNGLTSAASPTNLAWAAPERAVGIRFGADIFSISTQISAPGGNAEGRAASVDWRLQKPIGNGGPGFIWSISTGGRGGVAVDPEQDATMLLGYRYRVFDHLTLTSQVAMGGNYNFLPGQGWHSQVTPELKMSADLAALVKLPLDASVDLSVARQVPLVASAFETRGSAMLRFKYTLE